MGIWIWILAEIFWENPRISWTKSQSKSSPKSTPNMYLLYLPPKKGPNFPGTQRTGGQGPATSRYVFKLVSNLLLPHLKLVSNLLMPHSIQFIRAPAYQTFKLRGLYSEDNTQRTTLRGPVPGAGRWSSPWTLDPIQWVPTV